MVRLCRPSCSAISDHTAGSKPSVVSISRRTSLDGDFASRNCRMMRRSSSCSSENAKFTCWLLVSSWFTREPEHPLADDVALDLACAGVDGLRPASHERELERIELV